MSNVLREALQGEQEILTNGKFTYVVIDKAVKNRLLRRQSDGMLVIAHGWDGTSWDAGKYFEASDEDHAWLTWKRYTKPGSFGYGDEEG